MAAETSPAIPLRHHGGGHFVGDTGQFRDLLRRRAVHIYSFSKQIFLTNGLPEHRWADFLGLLAKELPGWSGMVLWRHAHPGYAGEATPIDMLDYLAVRLVLERAYAQRLAAVHFNCEASLPGLRGHLRRHPAELRVRLALYAGQLPEWLEDQGHRLVRSAVHTSHEEDDRDWLPVTRLIDSWRAQPQNRDTLTPGAHAWSLFVLCQHLGLSARRLIAMGHDGAKALLNCLQELANRRLAVVAGL